MVTHKRDLEGLKVWVPQLEFGLPGKLDNDITSISVNWGNTASCATPSERSPDRVRVETPEQALYYTPVLCFIPICLQHVQYTEFNWNSILTFRFRKGWFLFLSYSPNIMHNWIARGIIGQSLIRVETYR